MVPIAAHSIARSKVSRIDGDTSVFLYELEVDMTNVGQSEPVVSRLSLLTTKMFAFGSGAATPALVDELSAPTADRSD